MSVTTTSGRCSRTCASSSSASPASPTTVKPGRLEHADDAGAQQEGVVGDDDAQPVHAQGSWTRSRVPPPGWARELQLAVERGDPVREPVQARAGARDGAADAVVGDLQLQAAVHALHPDGRVLGLRVLGDVGQRLRDDEVRRRLDRGRAGVRRASRRAPPGPARGRRAPAAAGSRPRSESTAGWIPRASSRSSSRLCLSSSIEASISIAASEPSGSRPRPSRRLQRERDEPRLGAVVQVALEPAALVVAGLDEPRARRAQLHHARAQLGVEALVLQQQGGRRAGGADRLVLRERAVVHDRGDPPAVALDLRHRTIGRAAAPARRSRPRSGPARAPSRRGSASGLRAWSRAPRAGRRAPAGRTAAPRGCARRAPGRRPRGRGRPGTRTASRRTRGTPAS